MRRIILELYEKELGSVIEQIQFAKVNLLELLHFLKFDQNEIAAIGRVSFKDADSKVEDLLDTSSHTKVQLLEPEEGGSYMILVRWRPKPGSLISDHVERGKGYIVGPFVFRDGRLKITFLGNQKQVQEFLGRVEQHGLSYRVVSVTDAKFSPYSPLGYLTEKQINVLTLAFKLGYYDLPRKLNSDQLANQLNLANSTVVEHVRKAERRILAQMLGES